MYYPISLTRNNSGYTSFIYEFKQDLDSSANTGLKPDLSCEDILEHDPVSNETVHRIDKSCRVVPLKNKMSDPGKAVAD